MGRGLLSGGYVLVSLGFGVAAGYWAADWEMRFFPAVVAWVLLLWTMGLALFALGAQLEREERSGAGRLGRRTAAAALLALFAAIGVGAVFLASRPTALTAMAELELRRAQELDAGYFRELDRSLRGLVARVESERELFSGTGRVPSEAQEALLLDAWVSYLDTAMALDEIRRFHEDFYRFDLSRMERVPHVKSFLLSFASELSLYESTTRLVAILDANDSVERFLNVPRPEHGLERDSVARVREELSGLTDFGRVAAGKRYLSYLDAVHHARAELEEGGFARLWEEVLYYVSRAEQRRATTAVAMSVASDFAPILRGAKHLSFPVQKGIAEWMGDTRIKRAGGHYLVTREQALAMESKLAPGDVLLSRKNWYLSNIGLPGFWPHAILYVGTNEALASTFDLDPAVRDWVRSASGRDFSFSRYLEETYPLAWRRRQPGTSEAVALTVIEAVSEGVIQNSIPGASGDFVVALRPRVSPAAKARAIFRAFAFLDRPYDFDFDFATDHALVCTEVVWRAYRSLGDLAGLDLELRSIAGRLTLPANEIARTFRSELGRPDRQLDFVHYIEGREREGVAVDAGVEAFVLTVERSKWDFGRSD